MNPWKTTVFEDLKAEIFRMMDKKLDHDLLYHHPDHTRTVIKTTRWLCETENISTEDTLILSLAALFHDTGFMVSYENHERYSCEIARKYLTEKNFPEIEIDTIERLILATRIPQIPHNHLEKIICDADLNYLGTDDFCVIGDLLRRELILFGKIDDDNVTWIRYQIQFLDSHQFFTDTCKRLREPVKQQYLSQLKKQLKRAESEQNSDPSH